MRNLFLFFFSIILLFSCSESKVVKIAGSSTVLPVISQAAEQFRLKHPNIRIIVNAGGSGVGVNQIGEGKLDIGMISRELAQSEIDRYPNTAFQTHDIGRDAVVPVVSSEIYDAGIQALTLAQIGDIYKGDIRNWQALSGPDREILVLDKESSRGTRHVFMSAVFNDKNAAAPGADLVLGSNNEEQTAIVQSDGAIGMLSHAWFNADVKGLSIILADNKAISPTLENIRSSAFPIVRALSLVTNGQPEGDVKLFIDFLLSDTGQQIVEDNGYVRIR